MIKFEDIEKISLNYLDPHIKASSSFVKKLMKIDKIHLNGKSLTIFESGKVLGITVGKTKRKDVLKIMENYSISDKPENNHCPIYFYNDISISIFFDENNIVQEIDLGKNFKGKTTKGLKIGDHIDKAINLYGKPHMISSKGAVWSNIAVFCEQNKITYIRIKK